MSYPTLTPCNVPVSTSLATSLPAIPIENQSFAIGATTLYEVDADGNATTVPLGQSGPFVLTIGTEQILCSSFAEGVCEVYENEGVNGRAWNSTTIAQHNAGTVVVTVSATSVQSTGGGSSLYAGTSPQNPVWLEPVAWIYQNSDRVSTIDPYTYDNGTDGVGATMTQVTPEDGALTIDGGSPALADRVIVQDEDNRISNGIYVVTSLGDGASVPWVLTRSSDNDTDASLIQNWAATVTGTGELFPTGSQGIVTVVQSDDVGTGYVFLSLSANSTASGTGSTASGSYSTASGGGSTANGTGSTASGSYSTASGGGSTANGTGSTASGTNSTASGSNSTASGTFSTASGSNSTASGSNSTASGGGSTASGGGSTAYGDGQVAEATGDGQFSLASKTLGYITTSDATPTPLQNLNGQACLIRFVDTSGNPVWNKTMLATATFVARETDTPGTDSVWTAQGVLRGDGSSAYTWVGGVAPTPVLVAQDVGAATWTVGIDVGTDPLPSAAAALISTVTGADATVISWMCTLELDEVAG